MFNRLNHSQYLGSGFMFNHGIHFLKPKACSVRTCF